MKADGDRSSTDMEATIARLLAPGMGVLAADESLGTITRRFEQVGLESTEATRRAYRELLFSAPGIGEQISGVILFDETIRQQAADGTRSPSFSRDVGQCPASRWTRPAARLGSGGIRDRGAR